MFPKPSLHRDLYNYSSGLEEAEAKEEKVKVDANDRIS